MKFDSEQTIPVFTGPTASGKSALAMQVAQKLGGEIISADSMQIYRTLDIGTAKPSKEDISIVPHHLIDVCTPYDKFSVEQYVDNAEAVLEHLKESQTWPVIVGGTPQYITALVEGIRFKPDSLDPLLRQELSTRWEAESGEKLLSELAQLDPDRAAKLHPNDGRRIVRALEIILTSGQSQSEWDRIENRTAVPWNFSVYAVKWPRDQLYERINQRVDQMIENGLVEEAEYVSRLTLPSDASASQAIGYKEFFPYFSGEISLEEAVEAVKRNSRRYAKRQLTWFRAKTWVHWLTPEEISEFPDRFVTEIIT